jgi:hypothetical protein
MIGFANMVGSTTAKNRIRQNPREHRGFRLGVMVQCSQSGFTSFGTVVLLAKQVETLLRSMCEVQT